MDYVIAVLGALALLCVLLHYYTKTRLAASDDANFLSLQRTYLTVYLLAVAGDWLQGPHVYALYDSYNMTKHQIEVLFIAGFGSSLLFGTFVGSVADKFGRKLNCFIYGVLYAGACVTKHFNNFYILMVGRLLGGIATSILYSAFESWLVYEHRARDFSDDLLSTVFTHAALGNSLVAITSGVVAQFAANMFGYVAPFDVSLMVLIVMNVILLFTWRENYGDARASVSTSFVDGYRAIASDHKVLALGLIQSLFEGSMYVFVLEWTPALAAADPAGKPLQHGLIFSAFMVSVMLGSSVFRLLTRRGGRPESFMRWVLCLAALTLSLPIFMPNMGAMTQPVVMIAFVLFECCVGMFWPAMGFMRGIYVPEAARATIMNFFRVPLNLLVVIILERDLPRETIFACCTTFLLVAAFAQHHLYSFALTIQILHSLRVGLCFLFTPIFSVAKASQFKGTPITHPDKFRVPEDDEGIDEEQTQHGDQAKRPLLDTIDETRGVKVDQTDGDEEHI